MDDIDAALFPNLGVKNKYNIITSASDKGGWIKLMSYEVQEEETLFSITEKRRTVVQMR